MRPELPQNLKLPDPPAEGADPRWELVQRVSTGSTFEKSHRLRAFFLYVCRCALDGQPEAATEQQIGIHVFGRPPGYNPNEDNIVRSHARLLRLKLEHHFSNEGKDEPVVIGIPKGRYLAVFEPRAAVAPPASQVPVHAQPVDGSRFRRRVAIAAAAVVLAAVVVWLGLRFLPFGTSGDPFVSPYSSPGFVRRDSVTPNAARETDRQSNSSQIPIAAVPGEIRIAAGSAASYIDASGHHWDADRYYEGGVSRPGPADFFPPIPDAGLFRTVREGVSADTDGSDPQRAFRYDIPVPPGVYELRLYFADPLLRSAGQTFEDGQNRRHFAVNLNGRPLLSYFDAIADAVPAAVDVRTFKDVAPAADGRLHLEFIGILQRPFVSALELSRGTPGKLKPIRLCARQSGFVDGDGVRWSADSFFVGGRSKPYPNPDVGPKLPPFYTDERYGNFAYAIPVPPGSYAVTLHFAESFFGSADSSLGCHGAGCRVFDVTCNGVALLRDLDIFQSAGGVFRPLARTFHGLKPNAQGKLLLSFASKVDYAEVRAIEVIDEAK